MKLYQKLSLLFLALFAFQSNSFAADAVLINNRSKQQYKKPTRSKEYKTAKKTGFFIGTDLMKTKTHLDYNDRPGVFYVPEFNSASSWDYYTAASLGGSPRSNVGKGFGADGLDYGVNFGYEASLKNFLFRPEIAYEKFNNSSLNDPACGFIVKDLPDKCASKANISYRFGPKLNLGYKIFGNTSIYATAGYTLTNYSAALQDAALALHDVSLRLPPKYPETSRYASGNAKAPIFGGQIIYNLNNSFGIKLAYDYQNLKINLPSGKVPSAFLNTPKEHLLALQKAIGGKATYRINLQTIKLGIIYNF